MKQTNAGLQLVVIVAVSLFLMPAIAGDEDEKPPYMIYIDPETGGYTTTDPESEGVAQQMVEEKATQRTEQVQRDIPGLSVGVAIALALLLAGVLLTRRRA